MKSLYDILEQQGIDFERRDHDPVFTVEDVNKILPPMAGTKTKNLFLRDNKGKRHFLVVTNDEKQVDLKCLHKETNSTRLSFASPERLQRLLGISPGAVSLLALINDKDHGVELFFDRELWSCELFQCHPLVNTSTLILPRKGIETFVNTTGHELNLIDVPLR